MSDRAYSKNNKLVHGNTKVSPCNNIFVFIRQMAPVPACWLFKTSATS